MVAEVPASFSTAMGKPKEEKGPMWTKIHGRTIDLTNFRHPGGNIIELFYGMDATSAFEQFHGHYAGAFKMLRSLPTKEVDASEIPAQPDSHVEEMSRLMVEWRERGSSSRGRCSRHPMESR